MKNEATYHLKYLIESFGYNPKNIQLNKIKQSNKKPCYLTSFDLEKCSVSGFVFQNDNNEWIFNFNQSSQNIDSLSFQEKVKESEFLRRKYNRLMAKEAKIHLTERNIRSKNIDIKKARKLKKTL